MSEEIAQRTLSNTITLVMSGKQLCPHGHALPEEVEEGILELIRMGVLGVHFMPPYDQTAQLRLKPGRKAQHILFLRKLRRNFHSKKEWEMILGYVEQAGVNKYDCLDVEKSPKGYNIFTSQGTIIVENDRVRMAPQDAGSIAGKNEAGHYLPAPYDVKQ